MAEELADPVFERSLKRFEADVMEKVDAELQSGRLHDEGRVRLNLRKDLEAVFVNNLEFHDQMKLINYCGKQLLQAGEYVLSRVCFQKINDALTDINATSNLDVFRISIEARQGIIKCDHVDITQSPGNFSIAPMRISRLLGCLSSTREILDDILALSVKDQEQFAWLVLNACKMIHEIGHPLLGFDCSKYVYETFIFATLCMDAVINLCTTRHLKFKMKICSAAFSSLVTHGSTEEVYSLLQYIKLKVAELREREELDPPLQNKINEELMRAESDLAVMTVVSEFWQNPDSLVLESLHNPFPDTILAVSTPAVASYAEKCLMECIRTQELTASNTNEPWKKRSSSLLKAFMTYSMKFVQSSEGGDENEGSLEHKDDSEEGKTEPPLEMGVMTMECLVSVMSLAMFDELDGIDNEEVLDRINILQSRCIASPESEISKNDFALLKALTLYISSVTSDSNPTAALHLVESINDMIHSDKFLVRRTLLRKLALGMWSKAIYPMLQNTLSVVMSAEFPTRELVDVIDPMTTAAISLVFSGIEDPVLLGGVSIVIAQLLNFVGETRRCISFLGKAVECIDDHRAARVDVKMHFPDDVRDIKALQHSSFTCRADQAYQWHASAKRLGAHAFAGFGIFGTASSMAAVDQAICDLHLDMLTLLFRYELSYSIGSRSKYSLLKASVGPQDAKTKAKTAKLESSLQSLTFSSTTTPTSAPNIDKLPCISYLRATWGKSSYTRSILLVEMARVERKSEKKMEYLKDAMECVQEAEMRELELQKVFADLNIISTDDARHPVVIARSHSFFYVSPVGCKKHGFDKVKFFRVFGREEGSGTDISVTSDELGGCDELVKASDMYSPTTSAVRISSVRSGEKYAFASAAFDADGRIVGHVSPTSQSIEATNPLPIASLWANICFLAYEIGEFELSNRVSAKVCDYYMKLSLPTQVNRTFAKGINTFSYDRYFFNMLALQQASPVQLVIFVKCFLAAQAQYVESLSNNPLVDATSVDIFAVKLHWNFKSSDQFKIATNCHKLAMVTTVASMLQDHELIVRCVCMGYALISQSLMFDITHMSQVLLNPILVFLSALKVTPMANWQELDHQLYCRLLFYAIKCAVLNGNTTPLSAILSELCVQSESSSVLPPPVQQDYSKLLSSITAKASIFATPDLIKRMHSLLAVEEYSGENVEVLDENTLWNIPDLARLHLVRSSALALSQGEGSELVVKIKEQLLQSPPVSSQLIDVLISSAMQLSEDGQLLAVSSLLSTFPIRRDILATEVSTECAELGIDFVCDPTSSDEVHVGEVDVNNESKSSALAETMALQSPQMNEIIEQYRGIAHLCVIQAGVCFTSESFRNDFPESNDGPYVQLSHDAMQVKSEELLIKLTESTSKSNDDALETTTALNDKGGEVKSSGESGSSKADYFRRLASAVIFFVRSKYYQSAVDATLQIWKFITDQWYNPIEFASIFFNFKTHLLGLGDALVLMLETQCSTAVSEDTNFPNVHHPRTVKQNLYLLRYPISFILKVLCLLGLSKEVVEIGLRVLDVYIHHGPEYCNVVCDHCSGYLLFAQDKIISKNLDTVNSRERKLNTFVTNWEEAQAKKRKKKMRVVKVEKSDDELKFEAEKISLNDKLERAKSSLEFSRQKRDYIIQIEKRVDGTNTSGQQIFDRVRKSSTAFLEDCRALMKENAERYPSFSSVLKGKTEKKKFDEIVGHYDQVVMFLREKKDIVNLVSALHEEGDFYLLFDMIEKSNNVWRDGIDGYFNALDAWKDWQAVADSAVNNINDETAGCVLTVITILSKLSKHCSANDMDLKSNYCRLAAKLCLIPFKETINHPVDLHGFAAYSCIELGGKYSFEFDCSTFSAFSFHNGMDEIISVLGNEKLFFVALPILVLWEHFHGVYSCRPDQWLCVRLRRIQFLVELHLFSEATSLLAAILPSLRHIETGLLADHLVKAVSSTESDDGSNRITITQEVSINGFEFPNCPPFFNNQTVGTDANQLSITWISSFPKLFATCAEDFKRILPPVPIEDNPVIEEVVEAVEDKKKGKGKGKGKKVDDVDEVPAVAVKVNSCPLFSKLHHSEILMTCAHFLTEISSLDSRTTVDHYNTLHSALVQAKELLDTASAKLQPDEVTSADNILLSWNNSQWVYLYGKCRLLNIKQLFLTREFKKLRSISLDFLKQLSVVSNVYSKAKNELTHLWLTVKLYLARTAESQARFDDVIKITVQGSREAKLVSSSYWCRQFAYYSAWGCFKLGSVDAAQEHCATVSSSYALTSLCDLDSVRCKLLSVSILHAKLQLANDIKTINELGMECIKILRSTVHESEKLSVLMGFVGSDSNLTFESLTTSLMKHDRFTPFINGISTLHVNYPDMTPPGISPPHKHRQHSGNSTDVYNNKMFRAGPIDVTDVHTTSPMCNIYLEEVKMLALCSTSLCVMLDEFCGANVFDMDNQEDHSFSETELLKERIINGEAGLKILRHIAYPSSFVKASLFLSVGKARVKELSVQSFKGKFPGCEEFLSSFFAGLEVSMNGPHQWHIMKLLCLEIVECYGNQSLYMDVDSPTRLKMAVKYLLLCAQLDNMQFDVEYNSLKVLEEAALVDSICPPEAESLLTAMTSSSVFSFGASKENEQSTSADMDGKGKTKGKDEVPSGCKPCARDAFLILSSLIREQNPFVLDGTEYIFQYDLLNCVRKSFPQVEKSIFIQQLPNIDDELVVTEASVSCVWSAERGENGSSGKTKVGLFPNLTGYIVLGGLKDGESDAPSYLRKVHVRKSALMELSEDMVKVLNQVVMIEEGKADPGDAVAHSFCFVLKSLVFALQGRDENDESDCESVHISFVKSPEDSNTYEVPVLVNGLKICNLSVTSAVMQQFIGVTTLDKACYNLQCDKEVSSFLWGILRS